VPLLDRLLNRGAPTYAAGVVAISLLKYGIGLYPSWDYLQLVARNWRDPLVSPVLHPPAASYLLGSSTSAVAAGLLGLLSGRSFLLFHLVLALVAITIPFMMPVVRRSTELRLAVGVLLVGGAVPAVLLDWVGSYDPVTIIAATLAALAESRTVALLGWTLFAYNHGPEAGFALVVYSTALFVQHHRAALTRVLTAAVGWIAGYLAIQALLAVWGGGASRTELLKYYGASRYTNSALDYFPLIVVSALGIGWVLFSRKEIFALPAARVLLGAAALLSLTTFTPMLGLDASRVLAAVLWPTALMTAKLATETIPPERSRELLRQVAPVAVLLPILLVWDDMLIFPGWRSMWDFVGYIFRDLPIPRST
jgi:hypothetical protein